MQVGRAMSSPERKAWKIYRSLDVEYVFVLFGGFIGCVVFRAPPFAYWLPLGSLPQALVVLV